MDLKIFRNSDKDEFLLPDNPIARYKKELDAAGKTHRLC